MRSNNQEDPARSCSKFRTLVQLTCLYVPVKIWNSEELTSDQITLKFYEVYILEEMARDMKPSVISGKDTIQKVVCNTPFTVREPLQAAACIFFTTFFIAVYNQERLVLQTIYVHC